MLNQLRINDDKLGHMVWSAKTITALALASAGDQIRADLQEQS